ncbi:hypothetical protein RIF29_19435 [Crotalaria pallida]|uniref:Alpha-1,3-glucosyltransferase n=1 Tax=Crotalaria pallida TaxID=3830 RepID=A0AAN9F1R1_CROPI
MFNCISLGLTIGAVAAILSGKDLVACFLYCLSLNHKQMSAYFAPAFFSHLLGKCLRRKHPLLEVSRLGLQLNPTWATKSLVIGFCLEYCCNLILYLYSQKALHDGR